MERIMFLLGLIVFFAMVYFYVMWYIRCMERELTEEEDKKFRY